MRHLLLLFIAIFSCTNCESQNITECAVPYNNFQAIDQCGYVEVPRNWDEQSSETTKLNYLVIKSQSDNPKKDPVIFLQGGPGGIVLAMANIYSQINLDPERDYILYDQRGIGLSEALCPNLNLQLLEILALDLDIEEEIAELKKRIKSCTEGILNDGRQFSTTTSAKDLEALRKHLGYEQLNLFGGSYGTRLGLKYMELYPNRVRSAILSGLFPPEIRMYDELFTNFNSSFEKMFNDCSADENCNGIYPSLKSEFLEMYAELKTNPISISINETVFVLNQQDVLLFMHQMLYSDSTIEELPEFIRALKTRNNAIIVETISQFLPRITIINLAAYYAVMTGDEGGFNNKEKLGKDSEGLLFESAGLSLFSADPEVIEGWPSVKVTSNTMKAITSNIPTLLISGDYDPVTPPKNGDIVGKRLGNSQHIIFTNQGHVPVNPCFFGLAKQFLDDPNAKLNGDCAKLKTQFNWD